MLQKFDIDKINNGKPVILYGAAMYGELAFNALRALKIPVYAFCDRVQAGREFCGLNVISPEELKSLKDAQILICATKGLEGISNYLESISHKHVYEISELLPFVEYDKLPAYCRALTIEKLIEKYCYYLPEHNKTENNLSLSFVALSITERCSLKCKKCSVLAPYYKCPSDDSYDDIIIPFERFLDCIDSIAELQVGGGEPFMHKRLGDILTWCINQEKVKEISIFTNCTILPDDKLSDILANNKIKLLLDDYGPLSKKLTEFVDLCIRKNIRYIIQKFEHWDDLGDYSLKDETEKELTEKFRCCSFGNVNSFMKGKLYRCTTAARIADLGIVDDDPSDYVDFSYEQNPEHLKQQIRELLYHKKYHLGCRHCNGISTYKLGIPVAEQI